MARRAIGYLGPLFAVVFLTAWVEGGPVRSSASVPVCHARDLQLAASFYGEAGGQFSQTFTFTNLGDSACRMRGWPTLQVRTPSGRVASVRSIRVVQGASTTHPFRTVVLRPSGAASFDVYGADWDFRANRACPQTRAIFVLPPGAGGRLVAAVSLPNCGGFFVAPVIAGKTDRQSWSVVWRK